ncbi:hypothetical protein IPA_01225 [Ignicoccus pacificus DSM 13166]|uniref:4-vinyl reductase 4VR domain-containing protein n=1 Tax=Ignicoccus pacificus DSM 13166 TaxID=940294 RepID=A0A977KAH5_9CREN|nr:hypothetical protein IPA_01225 [Ignicoccus pacificus DSM 13166]
MTSSLSEDELSKLQEAIENESILIAKDVIADLYKGFEKVMMFAGGLLYNVAKKAGKSMVKNVIERGLITPEHALEALIYTIEKSGYADRMEIVERNEKKIVIRAWGTLLGAKLSEERRKKPVDAPVVGFIAGWLEEAWGRKVDGKEVKCLAKGDPYCEFELKLK